MLRKLACIILSIVLPFIPLISGYTESSLPVDSGIAWLMELYKYDFPDGIAHAMRSSFRPQAFDCGPAQVALQEVLYDGIWLYTSATVTPTNPEKTLIMPRGAGIDCLVAGGYGENLRNDPRSFLEAALQDQKQLLLVSINPLEFDNLPCYFVDHRQDNGDQSTLFSGAPLAGMEEALTIHLSIQLELIDPSTGITTHTDAYAFPVAIRRVGPVSKRDYQSDQEDFPFHSLSLIQTPLTVYSFPEVPEGEMESSYEFSLLDADLIPIPRGRVPEGYAWVLPELPEKLNVQIETRDARDPGAMAFFVAVDVEQ